MTSFEPNVSTNTMLKYRHICMSGPSSATMRSALVKSMRISSDARSNFSFSYDSRAKPLTTRMAMTFSSTDSFRRSYLRNTLRNAGIALRETIMSPKTSTGTTTTNIIASAPAIVYAIIIANTNISGLRMATRISIM